jgi:TonB-linked SusC/RagA family outer membrane protein
MAVAQDTGTVRGVVIDAQTQNPLPGVNVVVQEEQMGAATTADGTFEITGVPEGSYTLRASFVGYQQYSTTIRVQGGSTVQQRIRMQPSNVGLEEVVVTGVAAGTKTEKLGFDVSKVSTDELQAVPASDPANALRGKIAGAQIVQGSGDPSEDASIRLRGSTSITGDQQPLVIVDGTITSGGLKDISMRDVESIEVTKGAAASALYGSLAGNGVIQIRTKDGSGGGDLQVNVETEVGASQLAGDYPTATQHPWQMNNITVVTPAGDTSTVSGEQAVRNVPSGSKVISWPGREDEDFADDGLFDNPYPATYDNLENAATPQTSYTNYVSVSGSAEEFNYQLSVENYVQGGILKPVDNYNRNTFRLNADYSPNDRFEFSANASYVTSEFPFVEDGTEQSQGDNFFYSILTADPYIDVTQKNDNGDYAFEPTGYNVQGSNWSNPFYVAENREWTVDRQRLFGGIEATFNITDNWFVRGRQSIDRTDERETQFYPVGYKTPDDDAQLASGTDFRYDGVERDLITEVSTQYSTEFRDLAVTTVAKYLYEDREFDQFDAFGDGRAARGVRDIAALDPDSYDIESTLTEEKTENWFLNLDLDYDDTYILSGLVRRDGSSLFGEEQRWQTYFRGSLAYRLTQDFEVPNVSQLKLRTAYGTSGSRPPFEAQYATYSAVSGGLEQESLGNPNLKPSTTYELSAGVDATFLERFQLSATYARSRTEDDYLDVPLTGGTGFNSQWQNIGEVEATSVEASLDAQILNREEMSWNAGVTFSRVRQEITDLGPRPPYTRDTDTALSLFRVEEGQPFGAIFGNQLLTSLDQLTTNENGEVLNRGTDVNGDGQLTVDDYEINSQGYVIPAGTQGTADEQPVYMVNENGDKAVTRIGNTQPDFTMGLRSNFRWKGFGVYALVDWSQGGDVYNYTKQLLYFNYRHKDAQKFAEQGKHYAYTGASGTIYNKAAASSYFVEDGSFVKLREVSLSYTFDQSQLSAVFGNSVEQIELGVKGRNLLTFTDYTGWDPEVGLASNATNFRIDEYAYPNFRTYTGSLSVRF